MNYLSQEIVEKIDPLIDLLTTNPKLNDKIIQAIRACVNSCSKPVKAEVLIVWRIIMGSQEKVTTTNKMGGLFFLIIHYFYIFSHYILTIHTPSI